MIRCRIPKTLEPLISCAMYDARCASTQTPLSKRESLSPLLLHAPAGSRQRHPKECARAHTHTHAGTHSHERIPSAVACAVTSRGDALRRLQRRPASVSIGRAARRRWREALGRGRQSDPLSPPTSLPLTRVRGLDATHLAPPPPPPPSRTKWTRRVPHPVLIGHDAPWRLRGAGSAPLRFRGRWGLAGQRSALRRRTATSQCCSAGCGNAAQSALPRSRRSHLIVCVD